MSNLIIVDIQKEYSKDYKGNIYINQDYINKIMWYTERNFFNRIYLVLDCNSDEIHIPCEFLDLDTTYVYKNYAGTEEDCIPEMVEKGELEIVEDNILYKYAGYDEYLVITNNHHQTQHVNEYLKDMIDEIKYDDNVLIGGGEGECLLDIEKVLDSFNIKYTKNTELTYGNDVLRNYPVDWVRVDCPI